MNQEDINSTLNSSQLHDFGYAERKRYGQYNNASDIFNVKEKSEEGSERGRDTAPRSRRYQNHHYQQTCPYGRDDITVDNPHKVHTIYQEAPSHGATEGMMSQTEPNYGYPSEMAATEGSGMPPTMPRSREGHRRGMPPNSAASNGIERHEDIFVSREELQTPEQRKEALMKRQKLDQLLNGDGRSLQEQAPPASEPMTEKSKATYATPYATSFDMKNSTAPKPLNKNVSVSSLAPFATIEYNPYENYANARRSMASAQQLQAQAQAFNQQLPHEHDLPMPSEASYPHYEHLPHDHVHPHESGGHDLYNDPAYAHAHELPPQGQMSPSLQTPYFHETSSRPMPKEESDHSLPPPATQDYRASSSSSFKGKGVERGEDLSAAPMHDFNMPSSMRSPEGEGQEPLSKDHITSSFDKATALNDREYFNKIMNDPHHHQHPEPEEESITREKYEQAKHRFDELYRDIMNTEDLKNHPELIEELNKISPADLERFQLPPPDSVAGANPPPSQINYDNHGKEDYMNSLEDLDKKLEKITFDDQQTAASLMKRPQPQPQPLSTTNEPTQMPNNLESMEAASLPSHVHQSSRGRMNRRNFNESHIFDGIDEDSKAKAATTRPALSTSQSDENMSATAKARVKASNSYNNIFGTPEYHAEVARQEQEKRRLYSRRHWKLAQQNRSDIFCLGGDTAAVAEEEKIVSNELENTQLPPEVPTTIDRRATQMNLQASRDNPMSTTYSTMCHSFSSEDRQQMKDQPTFGLSSKQSHRTYKSKSRKFTPAGSSQILF